MIAEQATTHQLPFGLSEVVEQNVVASAKDKASATGSRVNKDAESLLRLGLPINSKEVCCEDPNLRWRFDVLVLIFLFQSILSWMYCDEFSACSVENE